MFQSFVKEQQLLTMLKVEIPKHLQTADWARMPKPGDRLNGLTRSTLLEIVQDPASGVRSAVIRKPGRTRGIRLIFLPSLFAYFERVAGGESDGLVAAALTVLPGMPLRKGPRGGTAARGDPRTAKEQPSPSPLPHPSLAR